MDQPRQKDEKLDRSQLEERHTRDPDANPGDLSHDPTPHRVLSNPVGEPDETEWPDPYEKRPDPREDAPPRSRPRRANPIRR
jgi:hypothetical protein